MNKKRFILLILIIIFSFNMFAADTAVENYDKGKAAYANKEYNTAIFYFKRATEINPEYFDAFLQLSHLYYDLQKFDYAYQYISKALYLSPKNSDIILFSAIIETELGRYEIAEKKFRNILKKNPLSIDAYNGLIFIYLQTNRRILAKKNLDIIQKSESMNYRSIYLMAKYYDSIDKSKAEKYYRLNIERNSLNPNSYFDFSLFQFRQGNLDKAIENILTAIKIDNKIKYQKYYGKYLLFENKGDQAVSVFRKILQQNSNDYLSFYHLAFANYLISNYDNTVESLKKALHLRSDDEFSSLLMDLILENKYGVDNNERKIRSKYYYNKAMKAKNELHYNLYLYNLRESIRMYPKNSLARLELAQYFLYLNMPERYIKELIVASKYLDSVDLRDRIEIEKKRISYKLGDDWGINQYDIERDIIKIPLFFNKDIENYHYGSENSFANLLQKFSFENYKYEFIIFDDKKYTEPEKMEASQKLNSPFFVNVTMKETINSINTVLRLYNSHTKELLKEYPDYQTGNDRVVLIANNATEKLIRDIPFKTHIIKISGDKGIINAGRNSGIKLKDKFWILKPQNYQIELDRAYFIYNYDDIKGECVVVKLDENIAQIKIKDKDYITNIGVNDIVIYKK